MTYSFAFNGTAEAAFEAVEKAEVPESVKGLLTTHLESEHINEDDNVNITISGSVDDMGNLSIGGSVSVVKAEEKEDAGGEDEGAGDED